ncbi:Arf17p [Stylosanthes scabra]|uniref:Auxin response factor n=1 Tax=Stylosanthes scabra TaxID=79078 RepID=A0ABU6X187_9FABA|nr:Arf17p [Stylosanthes scabra]
MSRGAPSTSASPPRPTAIPPKFWRACAGISAQEPPVVNSRVYYFPQGHIDQAASKPLNLSPLVHSTPFILCRVSAVNFLADPNTDEVFLKILLHPVTGSTQDFLPIADAAEDSGGNGNGDDEKVESYGKVLTQSDNRGGLFVPKSCADLIFPPHEMPPHKFIMTDLHGTAWEFRHTCTVNTKRHLLTAGWKKFADSKMLIDYDTLIFMKDSDGKVFVGLRRNMSPDERKKKKRRGGDVEGVCKEWEGEGEFGVGGGGDGAGGSEEAAEDVEAKVIGILWRVGMKVIVKMRATFESSQVIWFQGTVSGASIPAADQPWSGSPWHMLQITRVDPLDEMLKNENYSVSPWQVMELLSDAPALGPPTKKFGTTDGEEEAFPIPDSAKGLSKEALLSYYAKTSHAGMQDGASHDFPATPPTWFTHKRSFWLFGSTIQLEQPAESGARDDHSRAIDDK